MAPPVCCEKYGWSIKRSLTIWEPQTVPLRQTDKSQPCLCRSGASIVSIWLWMQCCLNISKETMFTPSTEKKSYLTESKFKLGSYVLHVFNASKFVNGFDCHYVSTQQFYSILTNLDLLEEGPRRSYCTPKLGLTSSTACHFTTFLKYTVLCYFCKWCLWSSNANFHKFTNKKPFAYQYICKKNTYWSTRIPRNMVLVPAPSCKGTWAKALHHSLPWPKFTSRHSQLVNGGGESSAVAASPTCRA